ncbi:RNA polymerase sigma factor RpoH [Pusillimonas noertemannii]|uniref:RNA polymerase sigma factor RpoH n=2 Tax=Pusillimonas noertemannii TaxID=305977 RepID=A0A2U1CNQ2_9BURK|nr:RNA polymerase sigma factor RpoH [Pusillimonas noertemannii]NYT68347.1 RNA polymerase sigma factor RpoH [Pusillimonas noertemannii]PVY62638.1 RNA polymerase RpoH-like sigma 32 subunit [Pusillimonas noertemannii]TFL10419.1 RNA polymerase sigma factor RpoH [Pusillimonas noertemannii]
MTTQTQSLALSNNALAMAVSNPGALGTIEAYIGAVNRLPLLSQQQETDLARRLRDDSDLDAARQLVLSHLRLVVSISRQYLGYGIAHADLIQEGNVGLMKAVKRFDPDRGVRLVSFAVHWIKAEIHEYIVRNWRMVKIATTKAQRKLFFNLRRMRPDGHTLDPSQVDDIARELNVRPEDVSEMEVRLSGQEMALEAQHDDADGFAPITYLADEGQEPSRVLERRALDDLQGSGLLNALEGLDERSRRIVEARWLQDEGGATLHELAAEFGVSAERIRQIEAAAFKKMRAALSEE